MSGAFPESLIRTESGGNWQALNNEQGAGGVGHGGRLQFGHGRLEDATRAGIIPNMTPQQFAQASPEIQMAVENWHFADIDRAIDASGGLDVTINGVPMTRDALRSVAHLGGIGGMNRFIETGGGYNPSDAYGTSLMDYARTHGGSGSTGGHNAGGQQNAIAPQQQPQMTPQQNALQAAQMLQTSPNQLNVADFQTPRRQNALIPIPGAYA